MLARSTVTTLPGARRMVSVWPMSFAVFLAMMLGASFLPGDLGYAYVDDPSRAARSRMGELNCGYDPRGALDEWSGHRLNVIRSRLRTAATRAMDKRERPSVRDESGVAVVGDDGTIVIPAAQFDLKNSSILFTPDGDGYRISTTDAEFDRDFGSRLGYFRGADGGISQDADNGYRDIYLGGAQFPFFGVGYDTAYVGTNGYITFTQGDTGARISPSALAIDLPRIAPLWADLEVNDSGNIYYNRLEGRHLFTWNRAGQPLYSGFSTFQAVLYDDGRIVFVYKKVKAHASLTGISPGRLEGEPQPIDFSEPPVGRLSGAFFETFAKEQRLDLPALFKAFYRSHSDSFDALYVWADFDYDNGLGVARSFNIRNDISGIGLKIVDRGAVYGSPVRLSTIITMGNEANWPGDPEAHVVGLNSAVSIVCHELGHRWLAYVRFVAQDDISEDLLGRDKSHWNFLVDTRTNSSGNFSSLMEGNAWRDSGGNTFTTIESAVNYFSPLDQYLMGLRSADDVGEIQYLETDSSLKELLREKSPASGFALTAARRATSIAKIVEREGPRVPDESASPKEFRVGFILLTERGAEASRATLDKVATYRDALVRYFFIATGRRGSLNSTLE
ncbi:MAG TPA: hypothetical protein VLM38_02415 [Blastocatellia bacterium]|nr:hypothetical protein [Blastocatellia bacterium]